MSGPLPPVDWIFLDAGNTLVHIDMEVVAGILRSEFGFQADAEAMDAAEPRARVHVDLERLEPGQEKERWNTYFWTILSAGGWSDRARVGEVLRVLFARNRIFSLWSRPARAVGEALERLRDSGYELAVISNSDGSVEGMLERLGLRRHLNFVIDSHVVGIEKPDPAIFRLALESSGADPAASLYVGDMYHIDVVGARGAGLHAALLDPAGLHGHRDCPRLREIAELPGHLQA